MSVRSRTQDPMPLTQSHRRTLRYAAALLSALVAIIYFMIGFDLVTVIEGNADQSWGILAALAHVLGVLLLLLVDRRIVWILGLILQVFVIFTYLDFATLRTPAFEVWGVLIRMAQFMVVIVLAYLVFHTSAPQSAANGKNHRLQETKM